MKRTIVRCESCSNVFTGIYTKGGELIVRGWEGCPQCGESDLRDLASAESTPPSGIAGSDRIADDRQSGRADD